MYSLVLAALEPNTLIRLKNQSFCLNFVLIASNILTTHCSMLVQQYGMPKNNGDEHKIESRTHSVRTTIRMELANRQKN